VTNAEKFMRRYMAVWPGLDDERLLEVVYPEATIHHSGMEAPIRGEEEPDYVRGIKALILDIGLEVRNWAANGDVVFVEYELSGSVAGRPLRWVGIGRFQLRGERAIDAIGRWDNLDLLAQLDGSTRRTAFAEAAAALRAAA
jgi:SnoaL-like domain